MGGAPVTPTDDVERLFRRLVANLAALDPTRLSLPFPVADIAKSLVPYRTHRLALRFETSEDYEMAVLRLLAGEGGYAVVQPDDAGAAFAAEVLSPNPDTTLFRKLGAAMVHLDPEHVAHAQGKPAATGRAAPAAAPHHDEAAGVVSIFARTAEPAPVEAADAEEAAAGDDDDGERPPFTLDEDAPPAPRQSGRPRAAAGSSCAYCGGELPVGRVVLFCPHCGQNVGVVHCPTCGSELDVGWKYCIACGEPVGGDFG